MSTESRFWAKVQRTESCWWWRAATSTGGRYGQFARRKRDFVMAHRFAWELAYGEIPPQTHVHHVCGNGLCVNPEHLELMPAREHSAMHLIGQAPVGAAAISAINRAKTHCLRGHAYTDENTYRQDGRRSCKECRRLAKRRLWQRQKARRET